MSGADGPAGDWYNDSGAGIITLKKGREGNRLNAESLSDLIRAARGAASDDSVRCIILRSNAAAFCLGMDFSALTGEDVHRRDAEEAVVLYGEVLASLYEAPKPVIAAVQGEVKAGGMGLIAASDIVVATEHAGFELSEVLFGLIPANVLPYLVPGRLTSAQARALVLSARRLSAAEALTAGLADYLVPADAAEKEMKKLLKRIFRAAPAALAATKRYFHDAQYLDFDGRKAEGKDKLLGLLWDDDVRKGIRAFQEGMVPEWFGRCRPEHPLLIRPEENGGE